jgi:hypothetical protein
MGQPLVKLVSQAEFYIFRRAGEVALILDHPAGDKLKLGTKKS